MAPDRDRESVRHMLDYAREALQLAEGRARPDLDRDRMLQLSLVRLVEVVGEAASRVSQVFRDGHPHIPWPLLLSKSLATKNAGNPDIMRMGQPFRAENYTGKRFDNIGQDNPKASDHCPVAMDLEL